MTETRALTYPELAEVVGRSEIAARSMAKRNRWRRMLGNDGRARVVVPMEVLERLQEKAASRPDPGPDHRSDPKPDSGSIAGSDRGSDARALIAVLESRISELQGRVAELDEEAKQGRAAIARIDVLEALLDTERKRVEEVRQTERQRAEEWKMVADRFAAQTEQVLAAQARRGWWPFRRRV
jgi:hypothetical protein